ncbi:transposase family protein [Streptomyces scopuliridis]|uniref:transposase family protein n=1 Tax=Streptomyces scopuliridis TaxID=452529 RepID=UPI00368AEF0D
MTFTRGRVVVAELRSAGELDWLEVWARNGRQVYMDPKQSAAFAEFLARQPPLGEQQKDERRSPGAAPADAGSRPATGRPALFWDSLVFDGIDDVDVEAATAAFGTVEVTVRGQAAAATCPGCGHLSGRVHDSCRRRLKDLPLGGQSVMIRLTVRRFICDAGGCSRRIFAEPFAEPFARPFAQLARPYARASPSARRTERA